MTGTGTAVEANADGLVGPTHSFAGLSPGNLASQASEGAVSDPRAAALEGLEKMARLAALGLPQFVLAPHDRPDLRFLRALGFAGADAAVLEGAAKQAPHLLAAASSSASMWAANAATVTPSVDAADGRVHLTAANLVANLHRSLECGQAERALRRLLPQPDHFAVHAALPMRPQLGDEGAANHVRLCAEEGAPGVNLLVWGRAADAPWSGRHPARQTREASEAVARRHGCARVVLARQSAAAIEAGVFHNDVVCVGARTTLLFHQAAFEDSEEVKAGVRRAAAGLFELEFLEVSEAELPLADAVASYLFNAMLVAPPGEDRLVLVAPAGVREHPRARAVAERLAAANGGVGRVEYVEVGQSLRNGGGPACLRLRLSLTDRELALANPAQRFGPDLHARLKDWARRRLRDRLAPADLADPALLEEGRAALDELTALMALGGDFYPFQRG